MEEPMRNLTCPRRSLAMTSASGPHVLAQRGYVNQDHVSIIRVGMAGTQVEVSTLLEVATNVVQCPTASSAPVSTKNVSKIFAIHVADTVLDVLSVTEVVDPLPIQVVDKCMTECFDQEFHR
jgi:hypothetical protein